MVLWCSARWWYKVNGAVVERLFAARGFCLCVHGSPEEPGPSITVSISTQKPSFLSVTSSLQPHSVCFIACAHTLGCKNRDGMFFKLSSFYSASVISLFPFPLYFHFPSSSSSQFFFISLLYIPSLFFSSLYLFSLFFVSCEEEVCRR